VFDFICKYCVVGSMELNPHISTGVLQLLLTTCVACGSAVIDFGINHYISITSV